MESCRLVKRVLTKLFVRKGCLISLILFLFIGHAAYAFDIEKDSNLLYLVNKEHPLTESYSPNNMLNLSDNVKSYKDDLWVRDIAATAFIDMYNKMKSEGIKNLKTTSGYRSYNYQIGVFNSSIKDYQKKGYSYNSAVDLTSRVVAKPGESEHQTGLAIDVGIDNVAKENFATTKAGIWLQENAYQYGFILRYPYDKTDITQYDYEPWHLRFVGKPHSLIMKERGICLEEYIDLLKNSRHLWLNAENEKRYDVYYTTDTTGNYDDIIDISSDNIGGYIITTYGTFDPMKYVYNHWSENDFAYLINNHYVYLDDYILPDNTITRGDFVMLINQFDLPKIREYSGFTDISETDHYYNATKSAFEKGLINGYDNCFCPNDKITRQEVATVLSKIVKNDNIVKINFSDISNISGWAFQDVQKLVANGVIGGYSDNTFRPNIYLTWGEAAHLICNLYRKLNS